MEKHKKQMENKAIKLIKMVLKSEGFYGKVADDAGGETYCGISRAANPKWEGWKIIDKHKPLKYNQKINDTTLDHLIEDFYYQKFYLPMKIGQIDCFCIAGHLFCQGVNSGISTAVKLLQKTINKVYKVSISVDGKIGDKTLSYVNNTKASELKQEFINQRNAFYKNLTVKKPSQKKFLNGWLNRVKSTSVECCN